MFQIGQTYTKNDLYHLLKVPEGRRKGAWDTGYREYEGNIYIFSNVGIPGRTGHDYNNYWDGDLFVWEGKTKSNILQPLIKKMLNPSIGMEIRLFTRIQDKLPFTYEGQVLAKNYEDTSPVKIVWQFENDPYALPISGNMVAERNPLFEGTPITKLVTKFERNPLARRICIQYHGTLCKVCSFDFYTTYGEIGRGFIHIHHIIPISLIRTSYNLDPENDLIPVCPNCHSMIHRKSPPIPYLELKKIVDYSRRA